MRDLTVLFLTKYARGGASSRYRCFQYLPSLAAQGIRCVTSSLLDDAYLARRYASGRVSAAGLAGSVLRRMQALASARRYDLLVIQKELLPYCPPLLERLLAILGIPYVLELDDAVFHQYDQHPNPLIRRWLGGKIGAVMRAAVLVIAGNEYLANYARAAGARRVELLPTVIDLQRYPVTPMPGGVFTIGWIGTPLSSKYLLPLAPALAAACAGDRGQLIAIGAGPLELPGVPVVACQWAEDSEVARLQACDVGIMPLADGPWERGKCGLKLIQYMACSRPSVASPVGANLDIIEAGRDGFLAATTEQWVAALNALRDDASLRERMGRAAREKVESQYSLQVTAPRLAALLRAAARH